MTDADLVVPSPDMPPSVMAAMRCMPASRDSQMWSVKLSCSLKRGVGLTAFWSPCMVHIRRWLGPEVVS